MTKKNQHAVKHPNGWAVCGEGNSRYTSKHRTQKEAFNTARDIARNQNSEILIHGTNVQIRERNTYGKDPYLPKG